MWSMREHINGLHLLNAVCHVKSLQVASLCGRIAADIYYALRVSTQDCPYNIGMHACTRWVGDDDIGASVFGNELVVENVLHIACIELGVGYVVDV